MQHGERNDEFTIISIGPGTKAEIEDQHEEHFRGLLEWTEGIKLGRYTARDPEVQVDYVYDNDSPAVALEISRITNFSAAAFGGELRKLERTIAPIASDNGQAWMIGVRLGSRMKDVSPAVESFMRSIGHIDGVLGFTSTQSPVCLPEHLEASVRHLLQVGIQSVVATKGAGVNVVAVSDDGSVEGFSESLVNCIASNAPKLGKFRPRQTHLYIPIEMSVSTDLRETPPPDLPPEIDVVWVHLGYWNAKYDYRTWRISRGETAWTRIEHPYPHPAA